MGDYTIDEAFPVADPGAQPLGHRILVQLRSVKKKSAGGIMLPDEAREQEKWNTMVARVVAVGPMAYRNRENGVLWPEGVWAGVGDFVRAPKYGGDRWEVDLPNGETALFAIFADIELIARITGDPLKMKVFV